MSRAQSLASIRANFPNIKSLIRRQNRVFLRFFAFSDTPPGGGGIPPLGGVGYPPMGGSRKPCFLGVPPSSKSCFRGPPLREKSLGVRVETHRKSLSLPEKLSRSDSTSNKLFSSSAKLFDVHRSSSTDLQNFSRAQHNFSCATRVLTSNSEFDSGPVDSIVELQVASRVVHRKLQLLSDDVCDTLW